MVKTQPTGKYEAQDAAVTHDRRSLYRRVLYRCIRNARLQAVYPQWVYRPGASTRGHAPWLLPKPRRFCRGHADEYVGRGGDLLRRLSRAALLGQHQSVLELVPARG